MRRQLVLVAVMVLTLAGATAGVAQTELTGRTAGGAFYKIIVPAGWTPAGGLVIWNHGFSLTPVTSGDGVEVSPLVDLHLANGFAVASSSYRQVGWALFKTKLDLNSLYQTFVAEFGTPDSVYLTGASLGGIVTAQAIEKSNLGNLGHLYSP